LGRVLVGVILAADPMHNAVAESHIPESAGGSGCRESIFAFMNDPLNFLGNVDMLGLRDSVDE
jgi:hypothetical protein